MSVIKPMIRSNICLNAHPIGCAKEVARQIDFVKSQKEKRGLKTLGGEGPAMVLVLGCSTGYGLASRITASFEWGADSIGVSFEKEATATKGGTPGWYNNKAFDKAAADAGIFSQTFNADAFSNETRSKIIDAIKAHAKMVDLVVYSLASPVRSDPVKVNDKGEHILYKSVIKPIGQSYSGAAIDIVKDCLTHATSDAANDEEIANTVKVMGGEDWALWTNALLDAGVLAAGARTVAYSYIGPELSHAIYRDGTIGQAKKDLEATSDKLNALLKEKIGGGAYVSINKGLVTRSSAVIPIISLYLSVLFKVMKEAGRHEGCIEQMERLFCERLFTADKTVPTDNERRIRIDDWEMAADIQKKVNDLMPQVNDGNLKTLCDLAGYKHDFLATNGFDIAGVNYDADIEDMTKLE